VRRKAALVIFLALLCFILGLVTALYFPIPARVGAIVTKLLKGKIRPFSVKRKFREIIAYVTDRKAGPTVDGNVTYLGQYASRVSYGLITMQLPEHHPAGSPIDATAIKKSNQFHIPRFLNSFETMLKNLWSFGFMVTGFHFRSAHRIAPK
jgi:hypothetical protein